jgi:three-Cys-motif partner protein
MPMPENYVGREQTFAKHILFEFYLEKLAYNILSFLDEIVYVDGFSGPWESKDPEFNDTSFGIAVKKLIQVRNQAEKTYHKRKKVRCLFIERDVKKFRQLKEFAEKNKPEGFEIEVLNGKFEDLISDILKFIGSSFSFIFIDPTGWTGYAYEKIKPLFQRKGEFLINFMFNHINRFIEWEDSANKAGFEQLFGTKNWEVELTVIASKVIGREKAIIEYYCERLRQISEQIKWAVTYIPISHPQKDRSWFYLIYATTHPKGLIEFHNVEKILLEKYGEARKEVLFNKRLEETGLPQLFGPELETPKHYPLEQGIRDVERLAREKLGTILDQRKRVKFESLIFEILQIPLSSLKLLQTLLKDLRNSGQIEMLGLKPRENPKPETIISLKEKQ